MSCFALDEWVGFVRQIVLPERMAEMQQHLDDGCQRCSEAQRMWRGVLELAKQEPSYQPPESAVRFVKEYFAKHPPGKTQAGVAMVARLIFDSFKQPLPAGVRTSWPLPRQLLFSAGDYLIHVRVEGQPKRVSLVGQLQNSSKPWDVMKNVPVALVSGQQAMAQAVTSSFGEFEFEFEPAKDLQLAIGLDEESSIFVSLKDVIAFRGVGPSVRRQTSSWQRGSSPRKPPSGRGSLREH